jgi:anion transporter
MGTPTVILFISLSIMGTAMFRTGIAKGVAMFLLKFAGRSEGGVLLSILVVSALLSTIASNTALVLALIPVVKSLCKEMNISTSKGMYPLAAGAAFGGACTLIGTNSNIVGNTVLEQFQLKPMGFFDIAWIGVPLTIAGIVWMMTLGRKLLPKKEGYEQDEMDHVEEKIVFNKGKMIFTAIIIGITLITMVVNSNALFVAALVAALVLIATGCISEKEAFASLEWRLYFLLAGFNTITGAVTNSGGGKLIADGVMNMLGNNPNPYFITAVLFIVTALLTSFLNNQGTVLLMGPIAVYIAQGLNINPVTLVIIVIIAANACFATPVGAPAFTLVLEPGHYKFKDFVRMGLPLTVINAILAILIIPLVWKF